MKSAIQAGDCITNCTNGVLKVVGHVIYAYLENKIGTGTCMFDPEVFPPMGTRPHRRTKG